LAEFPFILTSEERSVVIAITMSRKVPAPKFELRCRLAVLKLRELRLMAAVADCLNIKRQAPYTWRWVPSEHVLAVAEISGMTPHQIRPDIYPADLSEWRKPAA
jgi:hypothetical protein